MHDIVSYYNDIASIYDQDRFANTYGRFIDAQERIILKQLLLNPAEVVLDLACGSGRLLEYATCGVDASAEMAAIARRKFPEKPIYIADACATGLTDCSVDTIISFHFFMHLSREPLDALLRECARILRPAGRLIFDIPSKKRRQLLRYQATGWHGGFSLSRAEVSCLHPAFRLRQSFGLLLLPIHRVPKGLRASLGLGRLDFKLANSFLKEYSSYQVFELVKQ